MNKCAWCLGIDPTEEITWNLSGGGTVTLPVHSTHKKLMQDYAVASSAAERPMLITVAALSTAMVAVVLLPGLSRFLMLSVLMVFGVSLGIVLMVWPFATAMTVAALGASRTIPMARAAGVLVALLFVVIWVAGTARL